MNKKFIKSRKIALIGCGAVGMSFIYSAVTAGIAEDYILIDVNEDVAEGNALDIEDSIGMLENEINSIKKGSYADLKDVDLLVITASRPQKPGETRLEMVADNSKIMKNIAESVKSSGFDGITLIAANPVDTLTYVYWKITGFAKESIIGSGTVLDTSRLRYFLGKKFDLSLSSIRAWVIGEHGDSSIALYSSAWIGGRYADQIAKNKQATDELIELHKKTVNRAYEIINKKRVTNYGIGTALTRIAKAILTNERCVLPVGVICDGYQYGIKDAVLGIPTKIGAFGLEKVELPILSNQEEERLIHSGKIVQENIQEALKSIAISK